MTWMTRITGITEITNMTEVTGMTGIARMTGMTRLQGCTFFWNKKIQWLSRTHLQFSRIPIRALSLYLSEFPQHDCNCLSVFAPFGHLRIWVQQSKHWNSRTFQQRLQFSTTLKALNFYFNIHGLSRCMWTPRWTRVTGITGVIIVDDWSYWSDWDGWDN